MNNWMKRNTAISISLISIVIFSRPVYALVDYSEGAVDYGKASINTVESRINQPSRDKKNSHAGIEVATQYEMVNVQNELGGGKAGLTHVHGQFQTDYDLFFGFQYTSGQSTDQKISSDSGFQKGNPVLKMGLNWLRLGGTSDAANVDLYAGGMIPQKDSAFASTRTDKIIGIETSKRFSDFAFALNYEFRLTDTPSDFEEVAIGNIQKISAGIGFQVSGDIRFLFEATHVAIAPYKDASREHRLREKVGMGYITPSLDLGLSSTIHFQFGAKFLGQKIKTRDELLKAKLWGQDFTYGNGLFAGLGISI